ncbi:MAG: hypothetical protein KDJ88_02845, partial [Bauldia sp.]|nr:hypothetical protein [Bauldia sp.]
MLRSMITAALGGFALLFILAGGASAETKTFNNPMQGGNRLDWCYNWGTGCGSQAATAWCKANGYSGGATAFHIANDIGASHPTRLIS